MPLNLLIIKFSFYFLNHLVYQYLSQVTLAKVEKCEELQIKYLLLF